MNSYPISVTNHPLDSNKYIIYSPLEGPESGIFYRGQSEILENETSIQIDLPGHVSYIASNFSVVITPIIPRDQPVQTQFVIPNYYCSTIEENNFLVKGPSGKFYWHLFATRNIFETETMKSKIIGETGPYLWLDRSNGATASKIINEKGPTGATGCTGPTGPIGEI
jgi:hypothetical protein